MPDAGRTLRALAEAVVPGLAHDPTPGAPEIEAERFLSHYLEALIPGLAEGVATILDGLAAERSPGTPFAELDLEGRAAVLRRLASHEVAELRELADLLCALALGAVYGEWSGLDADGRLARVPLGWELTAWPGPTDGVRSLLRRE
jgi:hypothetical protein